MKEFILILIIQFLKLKFINNPRVYKNNEKRIQYTTKIYILIYFRIIETQFL